MKKLIVFLVGIALVNIMLIGVISNQVEADEGNTKNVDVVIVIDNSGSMTGQPWTDAVDAASDFIDKLKDGDQCAIFCFEDNENYSYYGDNYWGSDKPRRLKGFVYTTTAGKNELKNSLNSLSPDFSTPLFDTIGAAMDYIVDYKRSNSVGAIVALTDGEDNTNERFYPSHDYRINKSVLGRGYRFGLLNCSETTFIIGLGISNYSSYKSQLESIANTSDGAYYSSASSSDLGAIYDQIAEKIEEKRSEGEKGELPWLWILIIVIIVAVAAIIAVLLLRRKKAPMGSAPGPQQQQPQQQPNLPTCPICGGQLRFIPQYNRHWCDGCQKYK